MASSQQIERRIFEDFQTWLAPIVADELPFIFRMRIKRDLSGEGDNEPYPAIGISITYEPNLLNEKGESVGNYRADVMIECQTMVQDDPNKETLDELEEKVLNIINITTAIEELNVLSEFNTYKSLMKGISIDDEEDGINIIALPFTAIMLPSNSK